MHIDNLNQISHHIIFTRNKVISKDYVIPVLRALGDVLKASGCNSSEELVERLKATPTSLQMLSYLSHHPHAQSIRQTIADVEEYEKNIKN